MAIIYNIKHSLEIMVKFFTKISIKENFDPHHNLNNLFKFFRTAISKKEKSSRASRKLEKALDELRLMVDKYHKLKVLKGHMIEKGDFFIEDVENTFLRYPEKTDIQFNANFFSIVTKIKDTDIRSIKYDIEDIEESLLDVYEVLSRNLENRPAPK